MRFTTVYAPIKDGRKVLKQWFVFDSQQSKFIVGYMKEDDAVAATERANLMIEGQD